MFYKFSKTLFDGLISDGFHVLSGESVKKVYNDKTELLAFEKASGSNLYIVFIHNTMHYEMTHIVEELIKINEYFGSLAHIRKYKQVIVLNIMPTNTEKNETLLENFLKIPSNIPDAFIYNIFWNVDLAKEEIAVGKNQPSKVLGIEKIVNKAIDTYKSYDKTPNGETILDTYKETVVAHIQKSKISMSPPYVTFGLILVMFTILVYTALINPHSLYELNVNGFDVLIKGEYYRLITAMFVHANVMHYINNALGLYIFGTRVERAFGRVNVFFTFFMGALIGNIFSIIIYPNMYSVGASGGIYALLGFALCTMYFMRNSLAGLDFDTLAIMFIFMLYSTFAFPNINYIGHIVGFIVGVIIGLGYVFTESRNKRMEETKEKVS